MLHKTLSKDYIKILALAGKNMFLFEYSSYNL